jgi:retinol dehydrogenase-12
MTNKNVIITGGNAGIGLATSIHLAKLGANIYLVTRSKERATAAVEQIQKASGNKNVKYFIADLSSQKSIRKLAAEIKHEIDVIDVLINNAGAVFPEFKLTEDGLEHTIATNHFAYFLLTNLLLENIKKSDYARIVNVASRAHEDAKIDFDSFTQNKSYFIFRAYGQSKLANILFSNELARRLANSHVTVNSLHPGLVQTKIGNKGTQWYAKWVWTLLTKLRGISIEKGAATSIYLATSNDVKGVTGKYFSDSKEKKPQPLALDESLQKQLWEVSEKLCPIV